MKRTVYLIERICLVDGYESTSKVAATYAAAVNTFKTFVADTFIFNAIWDIHTDNEIATSENMVLYGSGADTTYRMHTRCGKPIYEFPLEKGFLKNDYEHGEDEDISALISCGGEITLEVGSYIFLLRAVEEET